MAIGFFVMDIFENTMKIMSVQAIPIKFPVILVHFTQKNCYLFRDSITVSNFSRFFKSTLGTEGVISISSSLKYFLQVFLKMFHNNSSPKLLKPIQPMYRSFFNLYFLLLLLQSRFSTLLLRHSGY